MLKTFCCSDLGIACKWKGTAETEKELIKLVAEHASTEHNMKEITEAILLKIRSRIREE